MLQNLLYYFMMYRKNQSITTLEKPHKFFQFFILPYECPGLSRIVALTRAFIRGEIISCKKRKLRKNYAYFHIYIRYSKITFCWKILLTSNFLFRKKYLILRLSILQVEIWQKYIAWERSNPLRIEDHNLLNKRVMFGFEQCLLCLGHFPNIWYTAASHLQECARILAEKGVKKHTEIQHACIIFFWIYLEKP